MASQRAYCEYLHDWADTHRNDGVVGISPMTFDEWEILEDRKREETVTAPRYLQVYYEGQETQTCDTYALMIPSTVTDSELKEAIRDLAVVYSDEKYVDKDMLEVTDEMLDTLASKWNGKWSLLDIFGVLEVEGYGYERKFSED